MSAPSATRGVRCPLDPHPFVFSVGFLLLLSLATPAAGQALTWGLKAGVNVANLHIDAVDLTLNPTTRVGALAGVFVDQRITGNFGVQGEGLISAKGTIIKDPRFDGDLKVRVKYLDIPLLARYRMRMSVTTTAHLLAGPVFSLKLGDVQQIGGVKVDDEEKQQIASTDVGLSVGGAVLVRNLLIDLRYVFGLKNINDDRDRDELIVRNRTLSVSVGLRFR